MILTLAFRNLFHDRIRLAVTLIGILFSIVLVAVQLGLYLGSSRMITANIDHAERGSVGHGLRRQELRGRRPAADRPRAPSPLWRRRASRRSCRSWCRLPNGASRPAVRRASSSSVPTTTTTASMPWSLSEGTLEDIKAPDAIAVDRSYLGELGINGIGDTRAGGHGPRQGARADRRHPLVHAVAVRLHHAQPRPSALCAPMLTARRSSS